MHPTAHGRVHSLPLRERLLGVGVVCGLGWYSLLCVLQPGRASTPAVDVVWIGTICLCSALAVSRAVSRAAASGRAWGPWTAMAAAVTCWTTGETTYLLYPGPVPFPSLADASYLAFYPCAYTGLLLLLRSRARTGDLPRSVWLDGLIGILAGGALVAWLVFDPLLSSLGGAPLTVATNLAYPLGDALLVLLSGALLVAAGRRAGGQWLLLLAGFLVFGVTDSLYLVETAQGTYTANTPLDAGWALGLALVAAAALVPDRVDQLPLRAAPSAVPVTGGLCATAVLLAGTFGSASNVAVALAGAAVAIAFGRLLLTLREVRRLAHARHLSLTDDLTGLPNRRALLRQLDARTGPGQQCTLVLLDLDGFKELNDTLGHAAGDELLRRVGQRLGQQLEPEEVFCRLGGDEFALLCPGADTTAGARRAQDLLALLREHVVLDGVPVHVGASAGVAVSPDHAPDSARLLQAADVSMYQAKRAGTGVQVYSAGADHHSRDQLAMAAELIEAIALDQLCLVYQPQVRLADGVPTGAEALVRWQHPVHGLLTPDRFLPVVQATGIARQLTDLVLRQAARQAVAWRHLGLPIAVNLTGSDLLDPDLPRRVADALRRAGAHAEELRLEVTEDALMGDVTQAIATLHRLRADGMHLSLDDFGQGHSSLARLRELPLDELKIDKAFIWTGTHPTARTTSILRASIALATDLGMTVLAEGLEDGEVWDQLRELGCGSVQGYAISRPVSPDAFEHWHEVWQRERAGRPPVLEPAAR